MGTGGISAGGDKVFHNFEAELLKHDIEATVNKGCSVHQVGCRGLCAKDVLVDVIANGVKSTYEHIKPDMVMKIVEEHLIKGAPIKEWLVKEDYHNFNAKQMKVVLEDCGVVDPEDIESYIERGGYQAVKKVLTTMTPLDTVETIKRSGLRGRGGGGFPTGLKWEFAVKNHADQKYIICNADEGDPGAFMDRSVIEGNPHSVLEGMIIGAYAIGATKGYVYIRAEYPLAVERLRIAIKAAKEKGFLGKNILGRGVDLEIKVKLGAGAFVCGEETALIASIEGKRGTPKSRPPFPAQKGLFGKPTVINNVETLANVPQIIKRGADWFASIGTEKSKGTKVFAITGKIKNSGLIEVPMGISLKEIIYDIGGGMEDELAFKAVQTGGPSGGCIPASMIDLKVDYESLAAAGSIMGSGGLVVMNEGDCMVNIAKFFLEFTQLESCGKCTPCRIGTKRLFEILTRITEGKGRKGDIEFLIDVCNDVKATSLCGLGMTAPNPILSTIKYFRREYEAHINEKRCPAKVCNALLTFTIDKEACTGCTMCAKTCPASAIEGDKKKPHTIISDKCIKCGSCFDVCKFKAVNKE
ncbi:MAG: NADH-quinone oxidoreductase subunit NuoF [Nitrospirae bacterium]|nr:NADH-quinone oxidoreductase subunit NuoF [Nitrospirota bacterium]